MLNYLTQPQPTRGTTAVRYIGRTALTAGASTYTFSNVNLGSASGTSTGLVVVVVECHDTAGTSFVINSVTVGGVSTTLAVRNTAGGFSHNAMFYIPWTSNSTTANIVVTPSRTDTDGCAIAVYRLDNISNSIPIQTLANSNSLQQYSWTFTDLSVGDLVIAATSVETFSTTTVTWTGLTENYDTRYDTRYLDAGASERITVSGSTTFTRRLSTAETQIDTVSAVWR